MTPARPVRMVPGQGADTDRTRGLKATPAVSCGINAWDWWAIGVGERRASDGKNNSEVSEADGDEGRESNFWKGRERELGQYMGCAQHEWGMGGRDGCIQGQGTERHVSGGGALRPGRGPLMAYRRVYFPPRRRAACSS